MSYRINVSFTSMGNTLAAIYESPKQTTDIKGYVLYAHCFTCGKDSIAAVRISRALVAMGFAVLRFDFTGIGASEGDFANSNFSSLVFDLVAAASFMRNKYQAPNLVIGHSIGGRAAISAARLIPECIAVATVGAPASPDHVMKQFATYIDEITLNGQAEVLLGGRPFVIKQQFIDDVMHKNTDVEKLAKPLLIMHSPIDQTVLPAQAALLYKRAQHPKSFVSLDTANHLLTNKDDAQYVAELIYTWSKRYLNKPA